MLATVLILGALSAGCVTANAGEAELLGGVRAPIRVWTETPSYSWTSKTPPW